MLGLGVRGAVFGLGGSGAHGLGLGFKALRVNDLRPSTLLQLDSVVLYCNFRSFAFVGLLGFLIRQLKIKFIATRLSAAK